MDARNPTRVHPLADASTEMCVTGGATSTKGARRGAGAV